MSNADQIILRMSAHVAFDGSNFVDPSRGNAAYTGIHLFMDRHLHALKASYSRPTGAVAKAVRNEKAKQARAVKKGAFFKKGDAPKALTPLQHGKKIHSELEEWVRRGGWGLPPTSPSTSSRRAVKCLLDAGLTPCDAEVAMGDPEANVATAADLVCVRENKRTGVKEHVLVEVKCGMDSNKHGTGTVAVEGFAPMPWTPLNRAKVQVALMLAINRGEVRRGVAKYALVTGYVLNVRTLDERLVEVGNAGWCKALSVDRRERTFPKWTK